MEFFLKCEVKKQDFLGSILVSNNIDNKKLVKILVFKNVYKTKYILLNKFLLILQT